MSPTLILSSLPLNLVSLTNWPPCMLYSVGLLNTCTVGYLSKRPFNGRWTLIPTNLAQRTHLHNLHNRSGPTDPEKGPPFFFFIYLFIFFSFLYPPSLFFSKCGKKPAQAHFSSRFYPSLQRHFFSPFIFFESYSPLHRLPSAKPSPLASNFLFA
jgi:hypothetical protein